LRPNEIDTAKSKSLLVTLIERFSNPLVLIFLFAATVSAATGDLASFVIIAISKEMQRVAGVFPGFVRQLWPEFVMR
jgi:magnesium-transporting ATPase (P-type)